MDQVSILQSELELIKFRLVELKDSKQNLEAHPNKSAMEIASIEELQNEIAQQEEQFCLVDEEMKQVKHTVKYELEKKAMIVKSTRDQIEDMLAQLKSQLAHLKEARNKLEGNAVGTEEHSNLEQLSLKITQLEQRINELEKESEEVNKELGRIASGSN